MTGDGDKSRNTNSLQIARGGRPRKTAAERTVPVTSSIPGAVLDAAESAADAQGISLSAFIARAVERAVRDAA